MHPFRIAGCCLVLAAGPPLGRAPAGARPAARHQAHTSKCARPTALAQPPTPPSCRRPPPLRWTWTSACRRRCASRTSAARCWCGPGGRAVAPLLALACAPAVRRRAASGFRPLYQLPPPHNPPPHPPTGAAGARGGDAGAVPGGQGAHAREQRVPGGGVQRRRRRAAQQRLLQARMGLVCAARVSRGTKAKGRYRAPPPLAGAGRCAHPPTHPPSPHRTPPRPPAGASPLSAATAARATSCCSSARCGRGEGEVEGCLERERE